MKKNKTRNTLINEAEVILNGLLAAKKITPEQAKEYRYKVNKEKFVKTNSLHAIENAVKLATADGVKKAYCPCCKKVLELDEWAYATDCGADICLYCDQEIAFVD